MDLVVYFKCKRVKFQPFYRVELKLFNSYWYTYLFSTFQKSWLLYNFALYQSYWQWEISHASTVDIMFISWRLVYWLGWMIVDCLGIFLPMSPFSFIFTLLALDLLKVRFPATVVCFVEKFEVSAKYLPRDNLDCNISCINKVKLIWIDGLLCLKHHLNICLKCITLKMPNFA